ncbi:pentapeptide repeat-containing protein [Streptomyces sp. 5.8]|uniref:pentapeptide repeat-containing protein n=1 Tax=Streptomyces sp. 5.8 TaxID=3406571 RepID=UPI003BB687C5
MMNSRRIQRRGVIALSVIGVLVVLAIAFAIFEPQWILERTTSSKRLDAMTVDQLLKAQNDVRATLLQAIAGALFLLTAAFAWLGFRLNSEGQVTERFSRAVDQLGNSDSPSVRVGGIFSLDRIARESSADRPAIVELLSSHVRSHVARGSHTEAPDQSTDPGTPPTGQPSRPPPDVAAALIVLGRIGRYGKSEIAPGIKASALDYADLRGAILPYANLRGGYLRGVDFGRADLHNAVLADADLQEAKLQRANLRGADLRRVNQGVGGRPRPLYLQSADLHGVILERAHIDNSQMEGAKVGTAEWNGRAANLRGAHMREVRASHAWLEGVDLSVADLRFANLVDTHLKGAILVGAHLQGADFTDAHDLDSANLLNAEIDSRTIPPNVDFEWGDRVKHVPN